jgi:cobalt-precorrin 5A hydrolase
MLFRALQEDNEYRPSLFEFDEKGDLLRLMEEHDLVLAVMAVGIVVRLICRGLKGKWDSSGVVAMDSSLNCAVPVVGGHHGANDLARCLARRLGAFPAITTATEAKGRCSLEETAAALGAVIANKDCSKAVNLALLDSDLPVVRLHGPKVVLVDEDVAVLKPRHGVVAGVGARKGVSAEEVLTAINSAVADVALRMEDVQVIATACIKRGETGMIEAAKKMGVPLVYLGEEVLNAQTPLSPSRAKDLGLSGVAEPAVLALARKLIMRKRAYGRVTVALGDVQEEVGCK